MADEWPNPERADENPAGDSNERAYNWIGEHFPVVLLLAGGVVLVLVIGYWALRPESAPEGVGFVYTDPDSGQALYRTLWDWLGLLIVPLAVAIGAAVISYVQKRTELGIAAKARKEDREIAAQGREKDQEIAQKARDSEQQIAADRLRQATLEGYYDRMTELLLEHGLRDSVEESEARGIARARTVAVVKGLDGERNGQLFAFLRTSKLIDKEALIVDLRGADLSQADLRGVDLSNANLSNANLSNANLSGAILRGAVLSGAGLFGADLRGAFLREADLHATFLIEANLSGADLSEAGLSGAVLIEADLSVADLSGADLSGADLSGAYLSEAGLSEADLSGADLSEADLSGADLSGAKEWTIAQFDQAKTLASATMPDGVRLRDEYNPVDPTYDEWKAQYLAGQQPTPS